MTKQKKLLLISIILFIIIGISVAFFIASSFSSKKVINYANDITEIEQNDVAQYKAELTLSKNDITIGSKNAPIQLVVYSSFSCIHCARFFTTIFPILDQNYIKTGKVLLIHRDFPIDMPSLNATKLLRCFVNEKAPAEPSEAFSFQVQELISRLFERQEWVSSNELLEDIFRFAGLKDSEIEDCLKDEELNQRILEERLKASSVLKIQGTPSFFVNGAHFRKNYSIQEFELEFNSILEGEAQK